MNKDSRNSQSLLFPESELRLEILDFTSIGVFRRCPLEYRYRYSPRNKYFDPVGHDIFLGRILHSITSDFLSRPAIRRNEGFNGEEYWKKFGKQFEFEDDKYHKTVLSAIDHLIKGPLSRLKVHALEYPFKRSFNNFLLVGRVDCLCREVRGDLIIDFKLNPLELDHHSSQSSRYLQPIFYYLGIEDTIVLNSPHVGYYFYINGHFEIVELSEKLISSGWEEIQRLNEERKETTLFHPRKNYYCSSCAVRNKCLCPLWNEHIKG